MFLCYCIRIAVMGDKPEGNVHGGNICYFPNCSTTSARDKGVSLFKPTSRKGEFYENWNKQVYNIVLRYRVDDEKFKELRDKK